MGDLTQLSVGGIVALLIVREVLSFLRQRNKRENGSGAGEQTIEFWRAQNREMFSGVLAASVIPILEAQTVILGELKINDARSSENQMRIQFAMDSNKESVERLRTSNHAIVEQMGKVIASIEGLHR